MFYQKLIGKISVTVSSLIGERRESKDTTIWLPSKPPRSTTLNKVATEEVEDVPLFPNALKIRISGFPILVQLIFDGTQEIYQTQT